MGNENIKIVGVGESGARAIDKMIKAGVGVTGGVEFVTVGNDENILLTSSAKTNVFLNRDSTLIYKRISAALRGAKVVILVTGAGSSAAAKAIMDKKFGNMVAMINGETKLVPLEKVAGKLKTVDPNCKMIKEAKRMGISFGDK